MAPGCRPGVGHQPSKRPWRLQLLMRGPPSCPAGSTFLYLLWVEIPATIAPLASGVHLNFPAEVHGWERELCTLLGSSLSWGGDKCKHWSPGARDPWYATEPKPCRSWVWSS